MRLYHFVIIILFLLPQLSYGQSDIAIGEWKSYLPYKRANNLTQSDDKVYFNTGEALFSIDKKDESVVEFFSKVDGLNGSYIKFINYDRFNEQLIVVYNDSKFDIVKDGIVTPIIGISQSVGIPGDKSIYSIHIADERFAYIGTGFGILQFNLETYDFGFTCEMGFRITDIDNIGEDLFAATTDGIYHYDATTSNNPADFTQWVLYDDNVGLPAIYDSGVLEVFNNELYVEVNEDVWKRGKNKVFSIIIDHQSIDEDIIQMYDAEDELLVGSKLPANKSKVEYIQLSGEIIEGNNSCSSLISDLLMEPSGKVWFCDEWRKIRYIDNKDADCNYLTFNSPSVISSTDIDIDNNVIFLATGGVDERYKYKSNSNGYSVLKNKEWENFYGDNFTAIDDNAFRNVFRILKHPNKNVVYLGSYYNGVMIHNLDDNSTKVYKKDNSCLGGTINDENRTRVSGLMLDDEEQLWISNYGAQEPITMLKDDGTCRSFSVGSKKRTTHIVLDDYGNKWFATFGGGIVVLKTGDDVINDPYEYKTITTTNSALQSNVVNYIIKDKDGAIWAGTDKGPVIFNCGNVFDDPCTGYRQKVVEDGDVAYLLETENIRCIGIDGANRKWFGTTNGIFVQSANGEEKVHFFNEDNSPIFDNTIKDLAFNPIEGEMFIATDNGLQSYRTRTTEGTSKHQSDVYAFPNPVRPDFQGEIAIRGLPFNASVKITDETGKLVYQTRALGGQALWDGHDYNGVKAATGVYLVFSSSTSSFEDPDSFVTKILVVN